MQEKRKLDEELTFVKDLKMLAQAYEEIAVIKMQLTRDMVLKTRNFLFDLGTVYYDVKSNYKHQIEALVKKKSPRRFPFGKKPQAEIGKLMLSTSTLPKNGKTVSVFISANAKFYGDIIRKVCDLFLFDVNNTQNDLVVVGKLGKDMFDQQQIVKKPYTYFDIPDSKAKLEDLKDLISFVIQYDSVTVYYGKFVNVITQDPAVSNISGEELLNEAPQPTKETRFLFEPSLEKILTFFETQIFSSLFTQTTHEAELARYASRIRAMEQALESADDRSKALSYQEKRVKNLMMNRKQLQALSGINLWSDKRG